MTTEVRAARPRFLFPALSLAQTLVQARGWRRLVLRLAIAISLVLLARLDIPLGPLEQAVRVAALAYLLYLPGELALSALQVPRLPVFLSLSLRVVLGVVVYSLILYPLQRLEASWLVVDLALALSVTALAVCDLLRTQGHGIGQVRGIPLQQLRRLLPFAALSTALIGFSIVLLADGRRSEDVWPRIGTIREYLESGALVHVGSPREDFNAWPALWGWLARVTDVDQVALYNTYMPPLLGGLAILAFLGLAQTMLIRARPLLLAAALFVVNLLALDNPSFFTGVAEDKYYVSMTAFFVAQALALRFAANGQPGYLAALVGVLVSAALIHPAMAGPAGLLVAVTLLVVGRRQLRLLLGRPRASLAIGMAAAVALVACFLAYLDLRDVGSVWFDVGDNTRRIVSLGGDWYIVDPQELLHPIVLGNLIATPLFILRARQSRAALYLAAQNVAIIFLAFNPLATAALNPLLTAVGVTRIIWLLPSALGVAYALELFLAGARMRWQGHRLLVPSLAGAGCFALLLVAMVDVRSEADDLWSERTATRDQLEGVPELADLLEKLPSGTSVLVPLEVGNFIPAYTDQVTVTGESSGAVERPEEVLERERDTRRLYRGRPPVIGELLGFSVRYDFLYFVIPADWLGCDGVVPAKTTYAVVELASGNSIRVIYPDGKIARAASSPSMRLADAVCLQQL